jgi:hypothetical protein
MGSKYPGYYFNFGDFLFYYFKANVQGPKNFLRLLSENISQIKIVIDTSYSSQKFVKNLLFP